MKLRFILSTLQKVTQAVSGKIWIQTQSRRPEKPRVLFGTLLLIFLTKGKEKFVVINEINEALTIL